MGGEVITSESIKQVEGEGMPREDNPFLKGNLVVKFVIDWPKDGSLDANALAAIQKVLPQGQPEEVPENAEEDNKQNKSAYDSDDEEEKRGPGGPGGQGVQCA